MNRSAGRRTESALVVALFAASGLHGQSGDSLRQSLDSQFILTKLTPDGGDIGQAGAVLVIQKKGLWMYSTASKLPPLNTYKNGKLSKSVSRDMAVAMLTKGNTGFMDLPKRSFVAGEKCWVVGLGIEKDGIVFRLLSDPYDNVRYYGDLKFHFEKGSVPTTDQALATIAEVLVVQPSDSAATPGPASPLHLPATYVSAQSPSDRLQLNSDSSFSLQEAGQTYRGTFMANGNTLVINIPETNTKTTMTIQGNKLTDPSGQTWVSQ